MAHPDDLPLVIREMAQSCPTCYTDRGAGRWSLCTYHEGYWDGYDDALNPPPPVVPQDDSGTAVENALASHTDGMGAI